jgi:hypothetical protein
MIGKRLAAECFQGGYDGICVGRAQEVQLPAAKGVDQDGDEAFVLRCLNTN